VLSLQLLQHLRDLTLVKVCRGRDVLPEVTDAEYEALGVQAEPVDAAVLAQLFDRFTRVVDRLPTSRVQRLLLEMGLLDLAQSEPLVPLGDLVQRLQALADGDSAGGAGSGGSATPKARGTARTERAAPARRRAEPAVTESPAPTRGSADSADADPLTADPPPSPDTTTPPAQPAPESDLARSLWSMVNSPGVVAPSDSTSNQTKAPTSVAAPKPRARNGEASPAAVESSSSRSPCATPPPKPDAIDVDALPELEAWEKLVARIRSEDEYVSAVLGELGLVALRDGVLRVAAPPRSFANTELGSRPEMRAYVEQATRDHLGRPYRLELVEGEPGLPDLPSIVLVEQARREQHQAEVERDAAEHAAIRRLLSEFEGQLSSTKPLD
jgi:DNA polymerase-3 subunit gamma/tau